MAQVKKSNRQMLVEERENILNGQMSLDDVFSVQDEVKLVNERRNILKTNLKALKK